MTKEKRHKVHCDKCRRDLMMTDADFAAHRRTCGRKAETLHTCPKCHRGNFTERGLATHTCRPVSAGSLIQLKARKYRKTGNLTLHPLLSRVPMMHEVREGLDKIRVRKPEHREVSAEISAELQAFHSDLDTNGIIEPLKITAANVVVDGRHRLQWAQINSHRVGLVPVVVVDEQEAARIIEGSVIARRHWTKGMKAYFAVLMHPEVAATKVGRPANSDSVGISREQLAAKFGVSPDLIDQACRLFERFEASKTLREAHEKLVWAGFGLGGILAGLAGHEATHEKSIQAKNLLAGCIRRVSAFGGSILKLSERISEDQRIELGESLGCMLLKLPEDIRAVAISQANDTPDAGGAE